MIEFFYMDGCPYCIKVRAKLGRLKIKFIPKNIDDEKNWEELMKLGGKDQVPFLVDGDVMMYESEKIIKYLEKS